MGLFDGISDFVGGVGDFAGDLWSDVTGQTAAEEAAQAQTAGSREALDFQREMFEAQQEMLAPYLEMSQGALNQMGALTGTQGAEAQQAAISALENSPMFQSQIQQGENAILQNAAATGGLRGGNIQGALAQYRPQMLQNQIQQQLANLGGIASMGASPLSQATASQGAFGQSGANILSGLGQANAANRLAQYQLGRDFLFDWAGLGANVASSMATGGMF